MHILILTDRDWLHPETGGTGVHLTGSIDHWLAWGHTVTVVAGGYAGAPAYERDGGLTVHRYGSRVTVFPHTLVRGFAGRVPQADVTLEIINGICWMTPLWRRSGPRVGLVHHVHRRQYADEMGTRGRIAARALETSPLRRLYRRTPFIVVSEATKAELADDHGIPRAAIDVVYPGVDSVTFAPGIKTARPTLLFLGRLKAYKRIEVLLDVVERVQGTVLDIAGDGDHGAALRADVVRRGIEDRVRFHGHVDDAQKRELLARSWVALTASSAEGWSSATMEAAASGTPTVAFPIGGLRESIVHGSTGFHVVDTDGFVDAVRRLVTDDDLRRRVSVQARARAATLSWEHSARGILTVLERVAGQGARTPPTPPHAVQPLVTRT